MDDTKRIYTITTVDGRNPKEFDDTEAVALRIIDTTIYIASSIGEAIRNHAPVPAKGATFVIVVGDEVEIV